MSKLSDFLGSLRPRASKILVERDAADFYALVGTLELARGVVDNLRACGEGEGAAEISTVFLEATEDFLRGRAQLGEFTERVAAVVDWREGGYAGTWPPPYGDIRDLLARVTRGAWERRAGLARGDGGGRRWGRRARAQQPAAGEAHAHAGGGPGGPAMIWYIQTRKP